MFRVLKQLFKPKENPTYDWQVSNNYLYLTKTVGNVSVDYVINKNGDIVSTIKREWRKVGKELKRL